MSRKSPTEFSDLFNQSPTPDSPPELDERILEYARRNTPQPARRQPLFLTAAATLSVACIGLMVVLRSGDVAPPETLARQVPPAMPAASRRSVLADSDSAAAQRSKEVSATIPQTEPDRKTSKQRLSNTERTDANTRSNLASAQSPAKDHARMQAFSSALNNQVLPAPGASTTQSGTTALDDSLGMAAPQGIAQATMDEALLASDKKSPATTKRVKFKIDNDGFVSDEDTQQSLREIKKLYAAGKKREAESAYRKLRVSCKQCELPASLMQALKDLDDGLRK